MKNEVKVFQRSHDRVSSGFLPMSHIKLCKSTFTSILALFHDCDRSNTCHGFPHHGDLATDPMPPS